MTLLTELPEFEPETPVAVISPRTETCVSFYLNEIKQMLIDSSYDVQVSPVFGEFISLTLCSSYIALSDPPEDLPTTGMTEIFIFFYDPDDAVGFCEWATSCGKSFMESYNFQLAYAPKEVVTLANIVATIASASEESTPIFYWPVFEPSPLIAEDIKFNVPYRGVFDHLEVGFGEVVGTLGRLKEPELSDRDRQVLWADMAKFLHTAQHCLERLNEYGVASPTA